MNLAYVSKIAETDFCVHRTTTNSSIIGFRSQNIYEIFFFNGRITSVDLYTIIIVSMTSAYCPGHWVKKKKKSPECESTEHFDIIVTILSFHFLVKRHHCLKYFSLNSSACVFKVVTIVVVLYWNTIAPAIKLPQMDGGKRLFPRLRGFWENVNTLRLHFFWFCLLKWRLYFTC